MNDENQDLDFENMFIKMKEDPDAIQKIRDENRASIHDVHMILLAICKDMGITLDRDNESDEIHYVTSDGLISFMLFASNEEGLEGHPSLSVCSTISSAIGAWLTFNCIVLGKTHEEIGGNIGIILQQLSAAVHGIRDVNLNMLSDAEKALIDSIDRAASDITMN